MIGAVAVLVALLALVAVRGLDRPGTTTVVGAAAPSGGTLTAGPVAGRPDLRVGAPAPAFEVATLAGGTFQLPAGKPTILTFVNLCPSCIDATRALGALRARFSNVAALAVATDPTADAATLQAFMSQAGNPDFALALDPQSSLTRRFDAFSLGGGVVVADAAGRITYRGPVSVAAIQAALVSAGAQR
ncbi:MAG: TlpA family protein disulfide reductase [Actinomycetota bacterium]